MFAYSILYAALITIITLAISYPAAYYITRSKFQNILLMIMIIPTWINLLLKTYAFIGLLSHDGVINQFFHLFNLPSFNLLFTTGAFLVVASYIYIPFMILPIFNSMKAIPNNLLQASSDLGASPFYTFRKSNHAVNKRRCYDWDSSNLYSITFIIYDYKINCR